MSGGEAQDEGEPLTIEAYFAQVGDAAAANDARTRAAEAAAILIAKVDASAAAPRADTSEWDAACALNAGPAEPWDFDEHMRKRAEAEARKSVVTRGAAPPPAAPAHSYVTHEFLSGMMPALGEIVGDLIVEAREALRGEIGALRARIADLEEQATRP